jgi:hypothetical protein
MKRKNQTRNQSKKNSGFKIPKPNKERRKSKNYRNFTANKQPSTINKI